MLKNDKSPQPAVTNQDLGKDLRQAPADDFASMTGPSRTSFLAHPETTHAAGLVDSSPFIGGRRFSSGPEKVDTGIGEIAPMFPRYSPGSVDDRQTTRILGNNGAALVALSA